jgi:hypothetical protein
MADITNKRINIYIDQQAAETALQKLQVQADNLSKKITAGQVAGKSMVAELKKLDSVNDSIKKVQQQLDSGLKPSLAQQTSLVSQLRNELKRLSESDPSFAAKLKNYQSQNAELQRMQGNIGLVSKETSNWGSSFEHVLTRIAEYASIYFVFDKAKEFLKSSIEEANKAEEANTRLKNILENLGRTDAFDRLKQKANDLAKEFKYLDNDDLIEVTQKLVTYGKLTENQINSLLPVIINFAAKSRISVEDSSEVIIKALEGNSRALKEYGINVKDGGNATERLSILMQELKPRVEGAAKAYGESFAGAQATAEQTLKNAEQELGEKLIPLLTGFYEVIAKAISGLENIFHRVKSGIESVGETVKFNIQLISEFAKGGAAGASAFYAQAAANAQKLKEIATDQKDLGNIQVQVNSIVADAAKKTYDEQQKIIQQNIALRDASLKTYNDLLAAGKQNTDEAKKAVKQYILDYQVVDGLQKSLAAQKDKNVLGFGGDGDGNEAKKLEEEAKKLEEARKKWNELLQTIQNGIAKKTQDPLIEQINEVLQKREVLKQQIIDLGAAAHKSQDDIKAALQLANQLAVLQAQDVAKAAINQTSNDIRSSHLQAPTIKDPEKQQVDLLNNPDDDIIGAHLKAHQKDYDEDTKNAKDAEVKQLENLVGYANQVVDIYSTIANFKTNQENAAFNKEIKLNDERKKSLQSLLNGKLISQNQYNKETQKLDAELEKKKEELDRKQFRRSQVQSIANTLIDGAQGEIKLWAELGAAAIPFQIALAAETLAKVGFIAAQKPAFGKGGALTGPSHSQGGMPVINPTTGQKEAEVEGGEYIISKNTVRNNKGLADALLFTSLYRNGAPVQRNYVPVDYAGITKTYNNLKFAVGGIMPAANPIAGKSSGEDLSIVLNAILQSLNTPAQPIIIQNDISLKQLDDANAQRTRIIQNANFKG